MGFRMDFLDKEGQADMSQVGGHADIRIASWREADSATQSSPVQSSLALIVQPSIRDAEIRTHFRWMSRDAPEPRDSQAPSKNSSRCPRLGS
jgi:hypothetical protein